MKVVSTNVSITRKIVIGGESIETGMYKKPVGDGVFLTENGVISDAVVDLKYHGGSDKASYFYGLNNYDYFKDRYPNADWEMGMFGENLTLDEVDESQLNIGEARRWYRFRNHGFRALNLATEWEILRLLKYLLTHLTQEFMFAYLPMVW